MNRVLKIAGGTSDVPEEIGLKLERYYAYHGTPIVLKRVKASGEEISGGILLRFDLDPKGRVYLSR